MHFSQSLRAATLLLVAASHLVSSSPVELDSRRLVKAPGPHKDTIGTVSDGATDSARSQLLGPVAVCADDTFDGSSFGAVCFDAALKQSRLSAVDMNQCIANINGQMVYQFNGNAFRSCHSCTLRSSDSLDLVCTCPGGPNGNNNPSVIDLDGTKVADGSGVFVQDDGLVACRVAPGV